MRKNQEETNRQKFPPKIIIRDGVSVDFKKINEDEPSAIYRHPDKGGYQELFPSVYSIEIPNEGFVKLYDFFAEEYLENRGYINYAQWNLHNYVSSLRNRGYFLSIKGSKSKDGDVKGLAAIIGMNAGILTNHLDHLEDCLLIHRVRRLDLQGMPNELIVHSPFTKRQLDADNGRIHSIIINRIARSHTKNSRRKAVVTGEGKTGGFGYLNRKATAERFQMDYKFIKNSFGASSRKFADFALSYFKKNLPLLKKQKNVFDSDYRAELSKQLSYFGIGGNSAREQCYIAANKFRTIYCPTEEEILA